MTISTDFFATVWGPLGGGRDLRGEIRAFRKGEPPVQRFTRSMNEAVTLADTMTRNLFDVYFGVMRRVGENGTAEGTTPATHVLWADFDAKNFNGRMVGPGSALAEVSHMPLDPHIIVDSGHGFHAYWLLDSEYPYGAAQRVMKGIERVHRSDHCSDAPRILRVPGTMNFKDSPALPVRLLRFDVTMQPYALDAFDRYRMTAVDTSPRHPMEYGNTGDWKASTVDAPKFGEGQRNNGLARLAGIMIAKGLSPDDLMLALSVENEVRCDPPLMAHEVAAIARSVERYRQ